MIAAINATTETYMFKTFVINFAELTKLKNFSCQILFFFTRSIKYAFRYSNIAFSIHTQKFCDFYWTINWDLITKFPLFVKESIKKLQISNKVIIVKFFRTDFKVLYLNICSGYTNELYKKHKVSLIIKHNIEWNTFYF